MLRVKTRLTIDELSRMENSNHVVLNKNYSYLCYSGMTYMCLNIYNLIKRGAKIDQGFSMVESGGRNISNYRANPYRHLLKSYPKANVELFECSKMDIDKETVFRYQADMDTLDKVSHTRYYKAVLEEGWLSFKDTMVTVIDATRVPNLEKFIELLSNGNHDNKIAKLVGRNELTRTKVTEVIRMLLDILKMCEGRNNYSLLSVISISVKVSGVLDKPGSGRAITQFIDRCRHDRYIEASIFINKPFGSEKDILDNIGLVKWMKDYSYTVKNNYRTVTKNSTATKEFMLTNSGTEINLKMEKDPIRGGTVVTLLIPV